MEIKSNGIVGEVNGRVVTGYLASFGNKDSDDDIIEKGAFSKTIAERMPDMFFLNQHKWNQPLAKFVVLREEEKGLYFETTPIVETSYGNDVIELYKNGIVAQHSIGFSTVLSEVEQKTGIRNIKEVKLYEGSCVTLGANPETPFTGFKNKDLDNIIKSLRSGNFTQEKYLYLESQLKQLQISLNSNEPPKDTHNEIEPKAIEILNLFKNFKL